VRKCAKSEERGGKKKSNEVDKARETSGDSGGSGGGAGQVRVSVEGGSKF
jgi:hypothetical protein